MYSQNKKIIGFSHGRRVVRGTLRYWAERSNVLSFYNYVIVFSVRPRTLCDTRKRICFFFLIVFYWLCNSYIQPEPVRNIRSDFDVLRAHSVHNTTATCVYRPGRKQQQKKKKRFERDEPKRMETRPPAVNK